MRVSEPSVRRDSRLFKELCEALLRRGNAAQFRVNGQSMTPNLLDGDDIVVAPTNAAQLRRGDVVLAENTEGLRVHRVNSSDSYPGEMRLRSDTGLDEDAPASQILGKVVVMRRGAQEQKFDTIQTRFVHPLRILARRVHAAAKLRWHRLLVLLSGMVLLALASASFLAPRVHAQTADLQLTQTTSATAVAAGSNYTYTEVVKNNTSSATVTSGTITVYM